MLNVSNNLATSSESIFDDRTFKPMVNLRNLDLSNTYCGSIPRNAFSFLKKLQKLNLRNTYLRKLPLFKAASKQTASSLEDASIEIENETLSRAEWNNPVLQVLILSNNRRLKLKQTLSEVSFPPSLVHLDLSGVQFPTINSKVFSNLNSLEVLRLNKCYVTSITSKALSGLDSLVEFSAFTNGLRKVPSLPKNLRALNLSNHRITTLTNSSIKPGISDLGKLTSIDLSLGAIKEIHDSTFSEMSKLETLNLSMNHICTITKTTFITK